MCPQPEWAQTSSSSSSSACLTLAIKAPLDSPAFGRLIDTQYRGAPLALVYYYMWETSVVWTDRERNSVWVQRQIELMEGWILTLNSVNLFTKLQSQSN